VGKLPTAALIFADRSAAGLAPLDRRYARPLLPVAGKELILYTVEELIGAGITDCTFVLSQQAGQIERLLGDGQRWGARFRFMLSRGDEAPSALWSRLRVAAQAQWLLLRGDLVRTPVAANFLASAQALAGRCVQGVADDARASLLLLRPGDDTDTDRLRPVLDVLGPQTAAARAIGDTAARPPLAAPAIGSAAAPARHASAAAPEPTRAPRSAEASAAAAAVVAGEAGAARSAAAKSDAAQAATAPGPDPTHCLALPHGDLRLLDDLADYHRANLDLVAGRVRGLSPAGRELAVGLIAGRRAQVQPRSLRAGRAYVGDNSRVHASAELRGGVVVARDVIVDRDAILTDSVILPHSYVGERVEVTNAIISGNQLIRVDSGAVLQITDAFLLSELGPGRAAARASWSHRIAGVLLLLLSLPLWPLALAAAALGRSAPASAPPPSADAAPDQRRQPRLWRTERLLGNRRRMLASAAAPDASFRCLRFNTSAPVLAQLPRLFAVISGHLRLIGVAPLTPQESSVRTEDWQRVRDQAPVGLLGPTQLLLPADAPLDERLMSDAFYAGQRSTLKDTRWLWVGLLTLFTPRAWRVPANASASGQASPS
jgi:hypothetical protein